MIDIKEWRLIAQDFRLAGTPMLIQVSQMNEILDRLEAAEKERDELRALVVMRFDHECPPHFTQGHDSHELTEPVTAEHCRWFVAEIERLRAKLAEMEQQEPVAWTTQLALELGSSALGFDACRGNLWGEKGVPLYALPVSQPTPSVPTDVITDYLVSISAHLAHQDDRKAQAEIGELLKMLTAAPEAKP